MDLTKKLYPAMDKLITEIEKKAESVQGIAKTGRTHLMDAMPVDFSDELRAWSSQLTASRKMLGVIEERFLEMPQGGTAVGTGINSKKGFDKKIVNEIKKMHKRGTHSLRQIAYHMLWKYNLVNKNGMVLSAAQVSRIIKYKPLRGK